MAEGTLILNAAKDIKNSVSGEDLENITRTTLSQILNTLLNISGPYAKNEFILGNAFSHNKLSNDISVGNISVKAFVKDGKTILEQMDYASPIQKYIKDDLVKHIGQCVDHKCGDGTTTAMIFATSFIANIMKYREYFGRISVAKMESIYKEITDDILNMLEKFAIKEEDNIEPKLIAYLQSYTSSGGMKNVAHAVSELIGSTPKELYEYAIKQVYPQGESDSGELVTVVKEDYQYGIEVVLFNTEYIFKNIDSNYECDDANVLVAPYGLVVNDALFSKIMNYIENEQDKPLIIITPNNASKNVEVIMNKAEQAGKEVLIFGHIRKNPRENGHDWELNALQIKANKIFVSPEVSGNVDIKEDLLINAKVKTNGKYLTLDGFLPVNDRNIHPVFDNPNEYQVTSTFLPVIKKLLDHENSLPEKDKFRINDLNRALSIITAVYGTSIRVQGTAMDTQMISLILDDATKASQHSIISGMVFNGPYRLFQATFESGLNIIGKETSNSTISSICKVLLYKCLLQASVDMVQSVYGEYSKQMQFTLVEFLNKFNFNDKMKYYTINSEFDTSTQKSTFNLGEPLSIANTFNFDEYEPKYEIDNTVFVQEGNIFEVMKEKGIDSIDHNSLPPCQPFALYKELFNRVRESGLRFAMIKELIVPGTVYDPKMNKGGE